MLELYAQYKKLMFTLAYQMTGSVADAEDAVQDVFVKMYDVEPARLTEPKAYLCKMVTNRCRDLMKSARRRREQYFGEWLPEPVPGSGDNSLEAVVRGELLSYAMLVLLEKLTPAERAAFVLREALGFDYADIAEIIGKTEASCRKLLSRARGKMGISPEEPVQPEAASEEWVRRFVEALETGSVDTVVAMLASDVTLVTDGGGKATAAVRPIRSRESVAKFLFGLISQGGRFPGLRVELAEVNGQTGIVVRSDAGTETVGMAHVEDGLLVRFYFIRNPDKLVPFAQA